MAAALAVRRRCRFCPTSRLVLTNLNLDEERRHSLAQAIGECTKGFNQLFVISHDDAFDALAQNTITVHKDRGEGAKAQQ